MRLLPADPDVADYRLSFSRYTPDLVCGTLLPIGSTVAFAWPKVSLTMLSQLSGAAAWFLPHIPASAGHTQHPANDFNTEFSMVVIDKVILYFRRFAKYTAASIWTMVSYSSRSARRRLSRAIFAVCSLSRLDAVA